ncbi:hypothetical protein [Brevibacillus fortis]|jgi:adenylate kinase family enzyme|uniref:hypothetical protein n=1 Tax=Brevibacillus TaxID=55080 RepID=UPI0038FCECC0
MKVTLWKRYLALLLMGCVLGGTVILFTYGREMEQMMLIKKSLELQNKKLYEENLELKQNQRVYRKKQESVIEDVRASVLTADQKQPLHATIVVQVVDRVEKDLASLKGKKVEQVAEVHQVLHEMLRRREYILSDRTTVEVRIKTVVISRTLHVFVTADVIPDDVWQKIARNFLFLPPYISI